MQISISNQDACDKIFPSKSVDILSPYSPQLLE